MPDVAVLYPAAGCPGAPRLLAQEGKLIVRRGDKADVVVPIGPGGAQVLGYYANVAPVRRSANRRATRAGWRILDSQGTCVLWLVHDSWASYDREEADEFASAAGLELRDLGVLGFRDLQRNRGQAVGPGTSIVGGFAAPRREFAFTFMAGGTAVIGMAPGYGPNPWNGVLVTGLTLLGMFIGVLVGQWLGAWWCGWRTERYFRTHELPILRPSSRAPGAVIAIVDGRLVAYDYTRTFHGDGTARLEIYGRSYPVRRTRRGLVVRWDESQGESDYVVFETPFDEREVEQFATMHGIELSRVKVSQVRKKPPFKSSARLKFANRLSRILGFAPVVAAVAALCAAVAVARFFGLFDFDVAHALAMTGFAMWFVGGVVVARMVFSDALVRPHRFAPRDTPT